MQQNRVVLWELITGLEPGALVLKHNLAAPESSHPGDSARV